MHAAVRGGWSVPQIDGTAAAARSDTSSVLPTIPHPSARWRKQLARMELLPDMRPRAARTSSRRLSRIDSCRARPELPRSSMSFPTGPPGPVSGDILIEVTRGHRAEPRLADSRAPIPPCEEIGLPGVRRVPSRPYAVFVLAGGSLGDPVALLAYPQARIPNPH